MGEYLPEVTGEMAMPQQGQAILPDITRQMPDVESFVGEQEPVPFKHPWKTNRTAVNKFSIDGGKAFGENGSSLNITDPYLVDAAGDTLVWLALEVVSETTEITGGYIAHGAELPAETDTTLIRQLVRLYDIGGGEPYICIDQTESNYIYLSGGDIVWVSHPWKVSAGSTTSNFNVKGGPLTVQGTSVEIADVTNLSCGSNGFIVLSVTRESDTREYDSSTPAVIEWQATTLSASSNSVEYYVLAQIISGAIRQHKFEEIASQELMIVENGELVLGPFPMLTRNTYSLPP